MIVVSDAGPLFYLNLTGAAAILPHLFGTIRTPRVVLQELRELKNPVLGAIREWASAPPAWVSVGDPTEIDSSLVGLQAGESAALSLAREIGADWIILDDGLARRIAAEPGRKLKVVGTLGVLDYAAEKGHITNLPDILDHLVHQTPFRCGPRCLGIIDEMKGRDARRKNNNP